MITTPQYIQLNLNIPFADFEDFNKFAKGKGWTFQYIPLEEADKEVDYHFPTPQTSEEACKEIDEIEAEVSQGKFVTLEEFISHTEKKLSEYEDCPL
ncbi:MAG: hypothetical protein J6Y24_16750 [Bacteroidales bacterium]|nr:hypothetical protein [Bacteroidales bacterium]